MEYKLVSFQFSGVDRSQKHHIIKKINSVRSMCPSDAKFTGQFESKDPGMFSGEVKVLFSKGCFFASNQSTSVENLMKILINEIKDQVAIWKEVRFDQPKTFIDYSQPIPKKASGS